MLAYLTDSLRALVEAILGERIDYYALHPCTVVTQQADGSLDVRPEPRPDGSASPLGDLAGVPIDVSLPGAEIKVKPGSRVLVGFRGGHPQGRFAQLTSMAQVISIAWESGDEFKCLAAKHTFDEAGRGAARIADLVAMGGGLPLLTRMVPCVIQLGAAVGPPPALAPIVPPPPMLTPGMFVQGLLQFTPKPYVGAITTSKSSHKI